MQVYLAVTDGVSYLIAQRPLRYPNRRITHQAGQFVFPGGERNNGETIMDAALREFNEETGVDLTLYRTVIDVVYSRDEYTLVVCEVSTWVLFAIALRARSNMPTVELANVRVVAERHLTNYLGFYQGVPWMQGYNRNHPTQRIEWFAEMANALRNDIFP